MQVVIIKLGIPIYCMSYYKRKLTDKTDVADVETIRGAARMLRFGSICRHFNWFVPCVFTASVLSTRQWAAGGKVTTQSLKPKTWAINLWKNVTRMTACRGKLRASKKRTSSLLKILVWGTCPSYPSSLRFMKNVVTRVTTTLNYPNSLAFFRYSTQASISTEMTIK